jgi:hypothetical protein
MDGFLLSRIKFISPGTNKIVADTGTCCIHADNLPGLLRFFFFKWIVTRYGWFFVKPYEIYQYRYQ